MWVQSKFQKNMIKNSEKKYNVYFKKSDCTMCLFKHIPWLDAKTRVNALTRIYRDWNGKFIISNGK